MIYYITITYTKHYITLLVLNDISHHLNYTLYHITFTKRYITWYITLPILNVISYYLY